METIAECCFCSKRERLSSLERLWRLEQIDILVSIDNQTKINSSRQFKDDNKLTQQFAVGIVVKNGCDKTVSIGQLADLVRK